MQLSRRLSHIPLGLMAALAMTPVWAEADSVRYWLERMTQAVHSLNYEGSFIYQHNGQMQTLHIVHGVDEQGERERLVTLSGPSREVLRNNDVVTCILPDSQQVMVEKSGPRRPFPITLPRHLNQLSQHYQMKVNGRDRIAGMDAVKLSIRPRDQLRYGQDIWLSEENGLLLRSETINEANRIVEQLMFTELTLYPQAPRQALQQQTRGEGLIWYHQGSDAQSDPNKATDWVISPMPPGFVQDLHRLHVMPAKQRPVEHFVYSDGLATISVFIETTTQSTVQGHSNMGAVNAYIRQFDGHQVTVVGEVPPVTVKMVADAVRRRQEAANDD
jgi:sigma-E factor negative regulatory protein RseB